jgi:hypothetical protein
VKSADYFRHDFYQGESYVCPIELTDDQGQPLDTAGWSGRSLIRSLDGETAEEFAVTVGSAGNVTLELTAEQTLAITPKRYLHKLYLTDSFGNPLAYIHGDVIVREGDGQ